MPHWLIKAALQRGISVMPASQRLNEWFQKNVTKSIELTPNRFEERLDFTRRHYEHLRELRREAARDFTAVELGTGWYPVVPLGLYLCGAESIWTYDIAPYLSRERLQSLLGFFEAYARRGDLQRMLPGALPERVSQLKKSITEMSDEPPEAWLERLNIFVRVQDAQQTGLNSDTVDLFVSTGVLEYIPRSILVNILNEFQRVGKPGAIKSHYLNLRDQYSYFDSSISPFNFLKFTDRQWSWFDSPLTSLNRLRISDYRDLFAQAGYKIEREINTHGLAEDLAKVRLAPEFQAYKTEDLLVLLSFVAARSIADGPTVRGD